VAITLQRRKPGLGTSKNQDTFTLPRQVIIRDIPQIFLPEQWQHTMNFEEIANIGDLAIVSEESVWQNFERLAAFIFEKNDFRVKVNTVKTWNKQRRQYDVIAGKSDQIFLVECKKWAGNRYRLSALKKAVEQHKERTSFYESITNEDAIPVLVTLVEEKIRFYEGVPLVPIQKLNAFINELDSLTNGTSFLDFDDDIPEDDMPAESGEFQEYGNENL